MCFFKHRYVFHPGNTLFDELIHRTHVRVNLIFLISHLCQLKHLLDNNCRLDFHTIYMNWRAIFTLYIHKNICKLNECIKLIFVSFKISHYLCMHRLADKCTQWPTLFRQWFCNSDANRHEICTRLRQRVKIKVLRISPECVKFHSMKLRMMFKLNLEKIRSSPLDLCA